MDGLRRLVGTQSRKHRVGAIGSTTIGNTIGNPLFQVHTFECKCMVICLGAFWVALLAFFGRILGLTWVSLGSHLGLTWVSLGSHLAWSLFFSAYSPTCRPFFFTCFSRSLSFGLVFTFVLFLVPFGLDLACFLECLGTLEIELPCRREHDSHTLDFLFSGLISRPDFAADFFKTFRIFVHFGAPLGRPFGCPCPFRLGQVQTKVVQFSTLP